MIRSVQLDGPSEATQRAVEDLVRAVGGHVDGEHPAFLGSLSPLAGRSGQWQPARVNVVDVPAAAADEGGRPDLSL